MPYPVVTVRVSKQIAIQCKDLAQKFGWQLADLLRTLIFTGAVFAFLKHKSPEREIAASTLLGGLKLAESSRSLYVPVNWGQNPLPHTILPYTNIDGEPA